MNNEYDVVIIGASISGLTLASYLGKKGIKMLIVDLKDLNRSNETREIKLINEKTIDFLKEKFGLRIPAKFVLNKINNMTVGLLNSSRENIINPNYIVDKNKLTSYLVGKLLNNENITFLEKHKIIEVKEEDNQYTTAILTDIVRNSNIIVKSKVFVDASGIKASLRKLVKKNRFFINELKDYDTTFNYEELLDTNITINHAKLVLNPDVLKNGSLTIIPIKENEILLSISSNNEKKARIAMKKYKEELFNNEFNLINAKTSRISIRRPLNSFIFKNVMLLGVSACQNNPLIKYDVEFEINSAYIAGKTILKALSENKFSTENLWNYNIEFMGSFGSRLAFTEVVKDFISSISTEQLKYLLKNKIISFDFMNKANNSLKKRQFLLNGAKILFKPKLLKKLIQLSNYSKNVERLYNDYPEYDDFPSWKIELIKTIENLKDSFLI